jgi:hypothetical protein
MPTIHNVNSIKILSKSVSEKIKESKESSFIKTTLLLKGLKSKEFYIIYTFNEKNLTYYIYLLDKDSTNSDDENIFYPILYHHFYTDKFLNSSGYDLFVESINERLHYTIYFKKRFLIFGILNSSSISYLLEYIKRTYSIAIDNNLSSFSLDFENLTQYQYDKSSVFRDIIPTNHIKYIFTTASIFEILSVLYLEQSSNRDSKIISLQKELERKKSNFNILNENQKLLLNIFKKIFNNLVKYNINLINIKKDSNSIEFETIANSEKSIFMFKKDIRGLQIISITQKESKFITIFSLNF